MTEAVTIRVEKVGPVLVEKSRRAKRLSITVKPFKGVRVAVPSSVSLERGADFAREKSAWMQAQLLKMGRVEAEILAARAMAVPVDREKAGKQLKKRLAELAEMYGFTYNKVTVRSQKTRWGSCSWSGNISLNMNLVTLPGDLIDYVLLHELVHLRVKNHGERFWKELLLLMPDGRERASRLKTQRIVQPLKR